MHLARLRRALGWIGLLLAARLLAAPAWTEELEKFLSQPRFAGAAWGVKVVSLDSGETLFEHQPHLRLSPASNCKLYVGALVLARLGGDYRIVTPISSAVTVSTGGTLPGDLVISGRGDPSWGARLKSPEFWSIFDPFVAAVRAAGIKQIKGDIVADSTWLRCPPQGPGWTVDDMSDYYGAEISAITLLDNYVELKVTAGTKVGEPCGVEFAEPLSGLTFVNRTTTLPADKKADLTTRRRAGTQVFEIAGGVPLGGKLETTAATVPRPAQWFAVALREALIRAGIAVEGAARSAVWPEPAPRAEVLLAKIESAPLRDLVPAFMIPSQNLETDLIFAHFGELQRTGGLPADLRSDDLALAELQKFVGEVGIPADEVIFDEGSGLSRNNLATANATSALLRFMTTHREADIFFDSLPSAGKDGTLRKRFHDTPLEGNLRAKTGSLRWAASLSGFLNNAAGEKLVFSLMLNRYVAPPERKASQELDEAAMLIARE